VAWPFSFLFNPFLIVGEALRWKESCIILVGRNKVLPNKTMLAAVPAVSEKSQHYLCLDLLDATFESAPPIQDNAILVEVWRTGGLLHINRAVPMHCNVCLAAPAGTVRGKVVSCLKEEAGHVVEFTVAANQNWFPETYFPPYLLPAPAHQG
jgi:hypothetical protein